MTTGDFVLQDGQKIVLIGDSITDCGRRKDHAPLGNGYAATVAAMSAAKYHQRDIGFINTGIGGNTVRDLAARWDADVLAHRPDWLSVSIGVNDVWRQVSGDDDGAVMIDEFVATYRELLEQTRHRLSGCGLILMTPSVIEEDAGSEGNVLLKSYVAAVKDLASKFDAFCVPIHQAMLDVLPTEGQKWTHDGVHPTASGHALIALTWLNTLHW